jgi:PHD/YefM family antitoxin component YafN of YafNO toxin-antitoxin module
MCATEIYKNFFKFLDKIGTLGVVEVTRNSNRTGCYILSKEEYEGMVETIDIMRDHELYKKILLGMREPIENCKPLDVVLKEIEAQKNPSNG